MAAADDAAGGGCEVAEATGALLVATAALLELGKGTGAEEARGLADCSA